MKVENVTTYILLPIADYSVVFFFFFKENNSSGFTLLVCDGKIPT